MQVKLLRVLQDSEVRPVGAERVVWVNVRVIAATNRNLERDVASGAFREDLFYRLNVVPIVVPPLRERRDDILPLARYFLRRASAAARREAPVLTRDAAAALRDYAWPGNVRELGHAVERAVQAADRAPTIALDHLPPEILEAPALAAESALAHRPTLDQVEARYIAATLKHTRGNQTDAAKILGISRKALWEKRKRYGIE